MNAAEASRQETAGQVAAQLPLETLGGGGLGDPALSALARIAAAHEHLHLVVRGHEVQHLAGVLADPHTLLLAAGALALGTRVRLPESDAHRPVVRTP
jgi:hypothetical protein